MRFRRDSFADDGRLDGYRHRGVRRVEFKDAFLAVAIGNLVAGLIISVLAELFLPYVDIILYSLFAVALVLFVIFVIKIIKNANKEADGEASN